MKYVDFLKTVFEFSLMSHLFDHRPFAKLIEHERGVGGGNSVFEFVASHSRRQALHRQESLLSINPDPHDAFLLRGQVALAIKHFRADRALEVHVDQELCSISSAMSSILIQPRRGAALLSAPTGKRRCASLRGREIAALERRLRAPRVRTICFPTS